MTNEKIARMLDEFARIYSLLRDEYRARAYATAATNVRRLTHVITLNDGIAIPGVGASIRAKINEFLRSGAVADLRMLARSRAVMAQMRLGKILGVGEATAAKWAQAGIYTRGDLMRAYMRGDVKLTKAQLLGLKYYKDLHTPIPREHVAAVAAYIRSRARALYPTIIFTVAGSYRRGAKFSGDIDILISSRVRVSLAQLKSQLLDSPNYVATIAAGPERWSFLWRHCNIVRQVDILNVPYKSYYPALLYFTGSGKYNEYMRACARERGYRLNQHTITRAGVPVRVASERDIFDIIGLKYVPPALRVV